MQTDTGKFKKGPGPFFINSDCPAIPFFVLITPKENVVFG